MSSRTPPIRLLSRVLVAVALTSCSEPPPGAEVRTQALSSCNPDLENCCPASGFTEKVLSTGPDQFSIAQTAMCVRALAGDDNLMVGPRGLVLGGPGNDTINAYDHSTVIPGPGADIVSVSGGSTVKILDLCEVTSGENLFGGGDGILVTPVSVSQLQSRGVTLNGFSTVTIQKNSCSSSCVTKPNCSGHGACAEGTTTGQVVCACNIDFTGTHCEIPVSENTGATTGALTISGKVTDSSGLAVVGAKVILGGSAKALRFTDFSGGYVFHVSAGSYTLTTAGGECALTPASVTLNSITTSKVQNFSAAAGCVAATPEMPSPTGEFLTLTRGPDVLGTTVAHLELRTDAAEAVARLQQIASEVPTGLRSLTIAGSPAIERQVVIEVGEEVTVSGGGGDEVLALTTAIAIGSTVVRFESRLPDDADAATISRFFATGRNFAPEDMAALHGPPRPTQALVINAPATPPPLPLFAPHGATDSYGELQVAASDTADSVIIGTQDGVLFSNDGGKTNSPGFLDLTHPPPLAMMPTILHGDPSVAVGAADASGRQAFYFSQLVDASGGLDAIGVWTSTDEGKNFQMVPRQYPVDCLADDCELPDQPQLIADRRHRAPGGDQIYLAFRNFRHKGKVRQRFTVLACSADSGKTWIYDWDSMYGTKWDHPRLAVSPNQQLLVAEHLVDDDEKTYQLRVNKFTSCREGMNAVNKGFPSTIVPMAQNPDDMAGLPRQPHSSYSITADDSDTSGNTLLVSYVNRTSATDDDVLVTRSTDAGRNWSPGTVINQVQGGHRYFTSICSTAGKAFVSWYDRRASSAASPDRTAYFRATLRGHGTVVGPNVNVTGAGSEDAQCLAGFPFSQGTSTEDGEGQCLNLPAVNLGVGECHLGCSKPPCAGSKIPCDFRASIPSPCLAGETCQVRVAIGGGPEPGYPTYGDYNGSACARGAVFQAWAAARAPQGACRQDGVACVNGADCCSGTCLGAAGGAIGRCGPVGGCNGGMGPQAGNGKACAVDSDCCSGTCQGGQCFARVGIYSANTACDPHETFGADNQCHACGANEINVLNQCQVCAFGSTPDPFDDKCTGCVAPFVPNVNGTCDCFPGADPISDTQCACRTHSFLESPGVCHPCEPFGFAEMQPDGSFACHFCNSGEHPTPGDESCSSDEAPRINECDVAHGSFCQLDGNCTCHQNDPSGRPMCNCVPPLGCESPHTCCPNPFIDPLPDPVACVPQP